MALVDDRLKTIFDCIFSREQREEQNFDDVSLIEKRLAIVRLFESPSFVLERYSTSETGEGLLALLPLELQFLTELNVSADMRYRGLAAIQNLFSQIFAAKCDPDTLVHLCSDAAAPNALNIACYMWWDSFPHHGSPTSPKYRQIDRQILTTMNTTLYLGSLPCQESALHGLGHWYHQYPSEVENIIDEFLLESGSALDSRLSSFAKVARLGLVQ